MSLSTGELFKFGFLLRCADEGLTAEQTDQRCQRALQQREQLQKHAGVAESVPKGLMLALQTGLILPAVGGTLLGASGGALAAAAMQDSDSGTMPNMFKSDDRTQDFRKQELIGQMRLYTQRLRALQQAHG